MTDIIRFCPLATLPFTLDLAHSCGNILDRLLRSSSGLGHRPLTAKIAGSNPVRSTSPFELGFVVSPDWDDQDRDFAAMWQNQKKWVVSRTLTEAGPNVTLIKDNLRSAIEELKDQLDGEIDVAGPQLAGSLTNLGLIDEYHIYLHPIVLGNGQPFFVSPQPKLRLVDSERIGEDVIRLVYVPA